jgi:hypothetical protein
VRRLERAAPFGFAVGVLAVALTGRLLPADGNEFTDRMMSLHVTLWIFTLGWVICRASTGRHRLLAGALVLGTVPGSFGEPWREMVIIAGLLLLLVPRVPVPRIALVPLGAVAGASLAIYLTHYAVYPDLLAVLGPWPVLAFCIAVGVLVDRTVHVAGAHALRQRRRLQRSATTSPTGA